MSSFNLISYVCGKAGEMDRLTSPASTQWTHYCPVYKKWTEPVACLTSEVTGVVHTQLWKWFLIVWLIRSLFTPCIPEVGGEIRASTPRAMPILQIKSENRQTVRFVFHVWRGKETKSGVARCESASEFSLGTGGTLITHLLEWRSLLLTCFFSLSLNQFPLFTNLSKINHIWKANDKEWWQMWSYILNGEILIWIDYQKILCKLSRM